MKFESIRLTITTPWLKIQLRLYYNDNWKFVEKNKTAAEIKTFVDPVMFPDPTCWFCNPVERAGISVDSLTGRRWDSALYWKILSPDDVPRSYLLIS